MHNTIMLMILATMEFNFGTLNKKATSRAMDKIASAVCKPVLKKSVLISKTIVDTTNAVTKIFFQSNCNLSMEIVSIVSATHSGSPLKRKLII